jgi:hypothetical protein
MQQLKLFLFLSLSFFSALISQSKDSVLLYSSEKEVNLLIINQLEETFNQTKKETRELKIMRNLYNQLKKTASIADCVPLLNKHAAFYDNKYESKDVLSERMRCLLLVGVTRRVVAACIEIFLQVIDQCYTASHYWKLHSHVAKQQQLDNIRMQALSVLGALVEKLKSLDITQSNEQLYNWVKEVDTIIIVAAQGTVKSQSILLTKEAFLLTKHACEAIPHLEKYFTDAYARCKAPNHFKQYWVRYLIGGIISAYVIQKNRTLLAEKLKFNAFVEYKNGIHKFTCKHLINPIKGFFGVAFSNTSTQHPIELENGEKSVIISVENLEKMKEPLQKNGQNILEILEKYKDIQVEVDPEFIGKFASGYKNVFVSIIEQIGKEKNLHPDQVQQLIEGVAKTGDFLKIMDSSLPSYYVKGDLRKKIDYGESIVAAKIYYVAHNIDVIVKQLTKYALEKHHGGLIAAHLALHDLIQSTENLDKRLVWVVRLISWVQGLIQKISQKIDLSLEILAFVPALISGYGLFKMSQKVHYWWRKVDYTTLNQTLCNIERLLVIKDFEMTVMDNGTLFYHVHKLKMHALKIISRTDASRQLFIDDLELLLNDTLNVTQKVGLIQMMYKRYKFLQ